MRGIAVMLVVLSGAVLPASAAEPDRREPEAISLLGAPLAAQRAGTDREQEAKLAAARAALAADPESPEKAIWVGRRLGYLWRMNEALAVYTDGIGRHPKHAPFYRHRGHRYISVRRFDDAVADLTRAAELIQGRPDRREPDGLPNARNIPLTTTAFNVWYHLGLAHYLEGRFEDAYRAYAKTMKHSRKYDDNLVATTYWTVLTLRRLGRDREARQLLEPIGADMDIIENRAYHQLLLLYKGGTRPEQLLAAVDPSSAEFATLGYGVGAAYLLAGQTERAQKVFQRVIRTGQWPSFGYIAAEVELARLRLSGPDQ